jgi:DNA modification methylase
MNNLELNKIYCESNLETMSRMPNGFVDYVLTSPPYNVSANSAGLDKYKEFNDNFSQSEYFNQQKELINELLRVTKNHVFYNIQMVSGNKIALHKIIGYFAEHIKEVIIWDKGFGQPAIQEQVFNSAFEYIIILSNNEPEKRMLKDATFNRGTQSNIFRIKNKHSNPYAKSHKAIMPLDVPRYFMQNFGLSDDLWYDPYMGTGTTAAAAIMEKKKFIGSEISKEYYDISNKRINTHINQTTLF